MAPRKNISSQVMTNDHVESLISVKDQLMERWDIDAVLPTFEAQKVITSRDVQNISAGRTSHDRVNIFVNLFVKKAESVYELFHTILCEKRQKQISCLIKAKNTSISSNRAGKRKPGRKITKDRSPEKKNIFSINLLKEDMGTNQEAPQKLKGRIMDLKKPRNVKKPQDRIAGARVIKNYILMCLVDDENAHIRCIVYNRAGDYPKYATKKGKLVVLKPLTYFVRESREKRFTDCKRQNPAFTLELKNIPKLVK